MFAAFLPVYKLQCTPFTNPLVHIMPASVALRPFKINKQENQIPPHSRQTPHTKRTDE